MNDFLERGGLILLLHNIQRGDTAAIEIIVQEFDRLHAIDAALRAERDALKAEARGLTSERVI